MRIHCKTSLTAMVITHVTMLIARVMLAKCSDAFSIESSTCSEWYDVVATYCGRDCDGLDCNF